MRTPTPEDRWHADYPLVDELVPLRSLAETTNPHPVFTLYAIRTDDGTAVGGVGFFGPPDAHGSVEVGYGLIEAFRGHGFATEALEAAVRLAVLNGAQEVRADTDLDNVASQRVLVKAGFSEVSRSDTQIFYTLHTEGVAR